MCVSFAEGRKKKEEKGKNKRKSGNQSEEEEPPPKTGRKKQKKKVEPESAIASVLPVLSIAHPSDVLDMPVDPNEPTYCLCHQVSYGEMIACDKMDVSVRQSNYPYPYNYYTTLNASFLSCFCSVII